MIRLAILAALIATPALSAQTFVCPVHAVHDGDTFTCEGGARIRVWGIDAPEAYTPAGPASTRALSDLLRSQTLDCTALGKSYDRIVSQCWLRPRRPVGKSQDIAEIMVRQGQAVDWPRYSHGAYAKYSKGSRR